MKVSRLDRWISADEVEEAGAKDTPLQLPREDGLRAWLRGAKTPLVTWLSPSLRRSQLAIPWFDGSSATA